MADMIRINDGTLHCIMGKRDVLDLVEETGGFELRKAVEAEFQNIEEEFEDETATIDDIRTKAQIQQRAYQDKLQRIDDARKGLSGIIREKEIDRKALSEICGRIGTILSTSPF